MGKNLRNERLAYIAGLVDGEGSISISRDKPRKCKEKTARWCLVVAIHNTDFRLLHWVRRYFSLGSVYLKRAKHKKWKDGGAWTVSGPTAVTVLNQVLPWLTIKKRRAQIAIAFQATRSNRRGQTPVSKRELRRRMTMYLILRRLNKKGKIGNRIK